MAPLEEADGRIWGKRYAEKQELEIYWHVSEVI